MKKSLSFLVFLHLIFVIASTAQNLDSSFFYTKANNYLFRMEDSEQIITPDSLVCFHYDNDTLIIDVQMTFSTIHNSANFDTPQFNDVGTLCGSTTEFISNLIGDKIFLTVDTVLFGHIDNAFFFEDTLNLEQTQSLEMADFNALSYYEFIEDSINASIVYFYQVVRNDFQITVFGKAKPDYKNLLQGEIYKLVSKYEFYFEP